ncbi:MAG: sigma-54-dependent Fis family transcriptional regulator, partial [Myxococcales bacterium]|nr:sigma-54-dependent Fis family transcriptional regulator [Myxococcales bacterium]
MARSILIVDDDPGVLNALGRMLQSEYDVRKAASGEEALRLLDAEEPDLLVTDVQLGDANGLEILEKMRTAGRNVPTIVMSGDSTVEQAVKAVKLGAYDFIEKPIRVERLKMTVENCLRFSQLHAVAAELQEELGLETELVGESPAMRELKALIAKVAPTEGRVLILGENGTGKELVAAAIHAGSPRRDRPFVKLNCSAIPAELVESEVFGHEKGAFTGAVGTRKGRFELADGGTLFLDEIGDMPERMQVKLLRVLQEGTFERVGGTRTMKVDVRIIAATNRDLSGMVAEGKFREDLYYRVNVMPLRVPPLRERPGDVPLLAAFFVQRFCRDYNRPRLLIEPSCADILAAQPWPGNVRELRNIIERLVIRA